MNSPAFSHMDASGKAQMVDVGAKSPIPREATASAALLCSTETITLLKQQALPKGDVLTVARIAGIQAAKHTSSLIPMCHQLPLESVKIEFSISTDRIDIQATVKTTAKTGVEMEALTAATLTALTIYDMMKAVDKSMTIQNVAVVEKIKG